MEVKINRAEETIEKLKGEKAEIGRQLDKISATKKVEEISADHGKD